MEVFDLLYLMLLPSVFLLTLCGLYGVTALTKDLLRQKEKAPTKCQSQRLNQIKTEKLLNRPKRPTSPPKQWTKLKVHSYHI